MLILGLDFETTGVDPKKDRVVECGLCLWDVERHRPMQQADFLVQTDVGVPAEVWAELTPIHGIAPEDVAMYGLSPHDALCQINDFAYRADALVAHNGTEFDALFHREWNDRSWPEPIAREFNDHLWIDTRLDVPEPMTGPLITQAAKLGFLNPFPHQALSDVLTMLRILDHYDIPAVVERAKIPNIVVEFVGPFESKEQAKELGYHWEGYKLPPVKKWLKTIKSVDFDAENAKAAPYRIARYEPSKPPIKARSINWVEQGQFASERQI